MDEPFIPRWYQIEGALFLASRRMALLADEPGVGKTAQALMAARLTQCSTIAILCPSIAATHWRRWWDRLFGGVHGCTVVRSSSDKPPTTNGIICSYNLAIQNSVSTWLNSRKWDCLILDESHQLNNIAAQRSKLIWRRLAPSARHVWCLSGTPMRNHPAEFFPFLSACGAYVKSYWDFVSEYCVTFETVYETKVCGIKPHKLPRFKELITPYILRRTKEQVLAELPKLTFELSPVLPAKVDVNQWYSKVTMGLETEDELFAKIAQEIRGVEQVLQLLNGKGEAADALAALQTTTMVSRRYIGLQKTPSVCELIKEELLSGAYRKIIIFAWHRDVIEYTRLLLAEFQPLVLYGGQLLTKRDANIQRFQKYQNYRVMIAQIAAAGVAIDLTAASEVAMLEASYVPADNAQAVMRAHRYGQKEDVRCRFFTLPNSIDTDVMKILQRKTRDISAVFKELEQKG
ncbi:MAG TPA: DEAD/DEAH box helicase [Nitrosospira sp.]